MLYSSPTIYLITDGDIEVKTYAGDCLYAKTLSDEIARRANNGELDFKQFRNERFANRYMDELCDSLKDAKINEFMKDVEGIQKRDTIIQKDLKK